MTFKDLFSQHATDYAQFRPHYPPDLFAWLASIAPARELAVDVGAGNGQAAVALAQHFERVIAVDPSAKQIANAPASPTDQVIYQQGTAEDLGCSSGTADLLVAAQAFHWFKQDAFFAEVRRVARPSGCLAVWCYGLGTITPDLDKLVYELYETRLGPCWEPERKLVEAGYGGIAFPFAELAPPRFNMRLAWSLEHLIGYLNTWSALKRHLRDKGDNPLADMLPRFQRAWGTANEREVTWPISVRAFRISASEHF